MAFDAQEFGVGREFFDWYQLEEGIVMPADEFVAGMDEREKAFHGTSSDMPEGLRLLHTVSSELAGQPFNTLITNRYRYGEGGGVYQGYVNPERHAGKIALAMLSGHAHFEVRLAGRPHAERLYSGRLMIISAQADHLVTPPQTSEERRIVFLGLDTHYAF